MTSTSESDKRTHQKLNDSAKEHLWLHFTRHSAHLDPEAQLPIIVKGEGPYIYTSTGEKIIDGLAGLFTTQIGHGRKELADAASKQMQELDFFPLW